MKVIPFAAAIGILLFGAGAGTGVAVSRHVDPLRQHDPVLEDWFAANTRGDAARMWEDCSPDFQKRYGNREDYIKEFAHAPSSDPLVFTLVASIPLAGYGKEMFYDGRAVEGSHITFSVYIDDQGKFEEFAP